MERRKVQVPETVQCTSCLNVNSSSPSRPHSLSNPFIQSLVLWCESSSQSRADPAQSLGCQVPGPVGSCYVISAAFCLSIILLCHSNHSFPQEQIRTYTQTPPPPFSPLSGSPGNSAHLLLLFHFWRRWKMMDGSLMEYFPCCFSKMSKISWSGSYDPTAEFDRLVVSRCSWTFSVGLLTINARERWQIKWVCCDNIVIG